MPRRPVCPQQAPATQPLKLSLFCDGQFADEETSPELSSDLTWGEGPELAFPHHGSVPQQRGDGTIQTWAVRAPASRQSPQADRGDEGTPVMCKTNRPTSPGTNLQEMAFWPIESGGKDLNNI